MNDQLEKLINAWREFVEVLCEVVNALCKLILDTFLSVIREDQFRRTIELYINELQKEVSE